MKKSVFGMCFALISILRKCCSEKPEYIPETDFFVSDLRFAFVRRGPALLYRLCTRTGCNDTRIRSSRTSTLHHNQQMPMEQIRETQECMCLRGKFILKTWTSIREWLYVFCFAERYLIARTWAAWTTCIIILGHWRRINHDSEWTFYQPGRYDPLCALS